MGAQNKVKLQEVEHHEMIEKRNVWQGWCCCSSQSSGVRVCSLLPWALKLSLLIFPLVICHEVFNIIMGVKKLYIHTYTGHLARFLG